MEIGLVKLSKNISSLSTGVVTSYALFILIGLITYILAAYLVKEDFEKKNHQVLGCRRICGYIIQFIFRLK